MERSASRVSRHAISVPPTRHITVPSVAVCSLRRWHESCDLAAKWTVCLSWKDLKARVSRLRFQTLFEPWFTDDIAELGTKDAAMQVRSAWCIELGELSSMTRGDIEKVKAFITRKVDRFRPSYGRRSTKLSNQPGRKRAAFLTQTRSIST